MNFKSNYISWDMTACTPVEIDSRFGRTCSLHVQGLKVRKATRKKQAVVLDLKQAPPFAACFLPVASLAYSSGICYGGSALVRNVGELPDNTT
jgi:hypothetical protein